MTECRSEILEALSRLVGWLQNSSWQSYDPYDYKGKPQVARLLQRPLLARVLHGAGLVFPTMTRRLLGIAPTGTASGYAYLVSGFSKLADFTGDPAHEQLARKALALLVECRIPGGGWGLPFDWQTSDRVKIPRETTLSYTTYTGLKALLDFYHCTAEGSVLRLAEEVADCTVDELNQIELGEGLLLSYSRHDRYEVLNTNALLGAVFCEMADLLHRQDLLTLGRKMLLAVIGEQNEDGSWNYFSRRYSASPRIDNYHSAMTLRGVVEASAYLAQEQVDVAAVVARGLCFYDTTFLDSESPGAVWPGRPYPQDVACVAEGTLLNEALLRQPGGPSQREQKLCSLLLWGIRNLQRADGHFLYRKYRRFSTDLRSIRWGQGMMLLALASAAPHLAPSRKVS